MNNYNWTSPGGDVSSTQLGNNDILDSEVGGYQTYPSSAAFISVVQGWFDDPDSNKGLILRRLYGNTGQYITYTTVEGTSTQRPLLTVNGKALPWPPFGTVITIK